MHDNGKVLIVDDEPNAVRVLSAILRQDGYAVIQSTSVDGAIGVVNEEGVDAIITDLKMPVRDGYQLFDYVSAHHPNVPVMFLTAYGSVDNAVRAVTSGVYYYFIKPPDYGKLKAVLAKAIELYHAKKNAESGSAGHPATGPGTIICRTPRMLQICRTVDAIKNSDSSVHVHGETGTGKEIIAWKLHAAGKRRSEPFIAVNCAAIPRELLESELFGYDKGAFTGAVGSRVGKFEEAGRGTLFLDEIGELEPSLQAKLLRVLQDRTIERLGSNRKIPVHFRLVSSTNRDLSEEMRAGRFREDLYYRINVVQIHVPPLRERKDDIPLLTNAFMNEFCTREQKELALSDEVMDRFMQYAWPGNVRELRNVIERAIALCRGRVVTPEDLPEHFPGVHRTACARNSIRPLKTVELQAIHQALEECRGNKSMAARRLGISRKAFYRILKEEGAS